jgi:calcineurin-like phosphoesterase family protein
MGRLPDFVVADTHFGHDNIIRYSRRPQDHDRLMVANWKAVVKPSDIVLHLGDVYFKQPELVKRARLPGQIYFLRGNHDRGGAVSELRDLGWRLIEPFYYKIGKWKFVFTHWPLDELEANVINVHGHTHTLPEHSVRHISLSVERTDYRPQRLEAVLLERIAILDNPERRADHERARQAEWVVAEARRAREEDVRLGI